MGKEMYTFPDRRAIPTPAEGHRLGAPRVVRKTAGKERRGQKILHPGAHVPLTSGPRRDAFASFTRSVARPTG